MNKFVIKLINLYQKTKNKNIKCCKYIPSCSNYGKEAFQKFNFFKASFLTMYRILRCNPFSKGGYDPVPLSRKEKLEKGCKECFDPTIKILKKRHYFFKKS